MTEQTRKDPRARVLSMTVRYKSATLDEFIEHHSHDVSCGGMFIKTPQPFPPGTLLKFEVRIAGDRKVMQGVGRVVWKRDLALADAERPSGMGVKFIKLDDDSRRLIDQLISSRQGEGSAFDSESAGAGVDAEATVGLGTDLTSVAPSKAPTGGPSFFPKTDSAELPPPEDRTVMKQAAELLEEALREVSPDVPAGLKATSLAPVGDAEEKEDTKPGRPSKDHESAGRLRVPLPKPPTKAQRAVSPSETSSAQKAASIPAEKPGKPAAGVAPTDMASVAREITEKAREVAASKAPAPMASTKSVPAKATPSNVDKRTAQAVDAGKTALAPPAAAQRSGSGRGLFWFLAVAACAAGTWWLWKPRPIEPLPAQPPTVQEPAAQQAVVPPTLEADAASAAPAADAASSAAAAPAVPPPSSAAAPTDSAQAQVASAAPVASVTVPSAAVQPEVKPAVKSVAARPKPKAAAVVADDGAATAPATEAAPAAPADAPAVAPKTTTEKPEAPVAAPAPAPKPATGNAPAVAPKPPPKKSATPAAESDNPY